MLDIKSVILPIEKQDQGIRAQLVKDVFECLDSVSEYKSLTQKLAPLLQERGISMHMRVSYSGGKFTFEFSRYVGTQRYEVTFYDIPSKDISGLLSVKDYELKRYEAKERFDDVYMHKLEEAVEYQFGHQYTEKEFEARQLKVIEALQTLIDEVKSLKACDYTPEAIAERKEKETREYEGRMRAWRERNEA
jgi:hypothetical protein